VYPLADLLPPEQKPILFLGVCAIVVIFGLWISFDAKRSLRRIDAQKPDEEEGPPVVPRELDWETLAGQANDVIERTISQFPPELRKEAERLGWSWFKWSIDAGTENLLGHFWGPNRSAAIADFIGDGEAEDTASAIILYLGNLSEYCEEEGLDFAEEVRITYLHELGHYLGLDEADLEERGLQ
jgi:predicted Zn-dependent protease with MMP-like domain